MSTAAASTDESLANLLFDYPAADIIFRSQDYFHFRVPKTSIVNNSRNLGDVIRRNLESHGANAKASLPVVLLLERGEIIQCLLTLIFLVSSLVSSTRKEIMELLFVTQKFRMGSLLIHTQDRIARQYPLPLPLPIRLEPALRIYSFAQKYGLRPEALQTARAISNFSTTFDDLDGKLDIISCASLYDSGVDTRNGSTLHGAGEQVGTGMQ
jgi:hypothetical protein